MARELADNPVSVYSQQRKKGAKNYMTKICSTVLSVAVVHLAMMSCASTEASITSWDTITSSDSCSGTFVDSGAETFDINDMAVRTGKRYFDGSGWLNSATGEYCIDDNSKLFVDGQALEGPARGTLDLRVPRRAEICDQQPYRGLVGQRFCYGPELIDGNLWISKDLFEGKCVVKLVDVRREYGISESHRRRECGSSLKYVVFEEVEP